MMTGLGFRPYETYKESRVDWIGSIPSTWKVQRAKWLFKRMDRAVRPEDDIVTCFRDGEVTLRNNRRTEGFTTALKEIGYQGIRKGDLVIHAMDAFAGAIGVSDSDGKSTPVYAACVPRLPNAVVPTFYAYYMRHLALSGFLVSLAKGIRERSTDFRFNDFAELEVPFPPLAVQRAIVTFLDDKCTKIEEAVKIKQDQITLLRERRQIIIQDAVTRGLNPAVPMKDSGIDWIGQIPAHWNVGPGRMCIYENKSKNTGMLESTVLSLSYGRVIVKSEDKMTGLVPESYETYQIIQPGDIVIRGTDLQNDVTSLRTGLARDKGIITSAYICLRSKENADSYFLHYLLHSYDAKKVFYGLGSGLRQNLSYVDFKYLAMPLPSIKEQRAIVEFLDEYCAKVDSSIAIKDHQIAALKEYKSNLSNAAVTGKIKVV